MEQEAVCSLLDWSYLVLNPLLSQVLPEIIIKYFLLILVSPFHPFIHSLTQSFIDSFNTLAPKNSYIHVCTVVRKQAYA